MGRMYMLWCWLRKKNKFFAKFVNNIDFSTIKDLAGERTLTAESGSYYMVVRKTNDLLSDVLIYFGIENPLVCTEVVNLVD